MNLKQEKRNNDLGMNNNHNNNVSAPVSNQLRRLN